MTLFPVQTYADTLRKEEENRTRRILISDTLRSFKTPRGIGSVLVQKKKWEKKCYNPAYLTKQPIHQDGGKLLIARRLDHPVDPVSLVHAQPAHIVTGDLIEGGRIQRVRRVCLDLAGLLTGLRPYPPIDDVHAPGPLARGLDSDILRLRYGCPRRIILGQHVPNARRVVEGQVGLAAVAEHGFDLVEDARHEGLNPQRKRAARLGDGLDGLVEVVLPQRKRSGDVEREEGQLELLRQLGRVRRQDGFAVDEGRHGRGRVGRGQGVDAGGGNGVGVAVEFGDGGHVALDVDGTAHDDELLDAQEGLGILSSGQSHVCQGTNGNDGDSVLWRLLQDAEDLLVCRLLAGGEILGVRRGLNIGALGLFVAKQRTPGVGGGKMGLLEQRSANANDAGKVGDHMGLYLLVDAMKTISTI